MKRLLIICGPTATGKTELGVHLAKKFKGEIVSSDSRHVYKGMDIITGKDLVGDVPVWLVDIVPPNYTFSVGEYSLLAHKAINDIWLRSRLPIVVGGSGLYIRSIIDNLEYVKIPPNKLLRSQIEKFSKEKLQQELIRIDLKKWERMNESDRENPRRLTRAIEVALYYQKNKSPQVGLNPLPIDSLLFIGLCAPMEFLFKKIDERVEKRIEEGAVEEVKELLNKNYSPFLPALSSTGYRQLCEFILGRESLTEAIKSWKFAEHAYGSRQMTWFKKAIQQHHGFWFNISEKDFSEQIEDKVRVWYTSGSDAVKN